MTFDTHYHLKPPSQETIGERLRDNLLRETLPYLQKLEGSPSTSAMLRGLIADITYLTRGKA